MMLSSTADPEEFDVAKSHLNFPVIGIGASAGGLGALQKLLQRMPPAPGMAFVVVMHLSPEHESMLGAILQRATALPIRTVTESVRIEVDHIYVISPALKLIMSDGHLHVAPLLTLQARGSSIDLFFRTLAQAHRERSVGIVLSGTGSDGAQGLRRVKELGGVAISLSLEDAEFDGMPGAAIQTGVIDFVLTLEEMPAQLVLLWENARRLELPHPPAELEVLSSTGEAEVLAEEALVSIKAILRERTGHDFSDYKRGTVLRRIERRMQVNAVPDLPTYRKLLDTQPRETPALLQDMLISVTNFFRDPDAFDALRKALGRLIEERPGIQPFRAWVAGCATGEEDYSIAILLHELLGPHGPQIQVFASDIDERAVASARTGVFPLSIAADVEPSRLQRFFIQEDAGLRINKELRDSVIFSAHNLLSDPPFTRMDLICCRNVLIYLNRSAQAQALRSFHFALKLHGLLFMGSSETVDAAEGHFEDVDKIRRIYRVNAKSTKARVLPPIPTRIPDVYVGPVGLVREVAPKPPLEMLHERILREYSPPTVLVDQDDTVLHVSERASHLLRVPEGAPTNKLLKLIRPELRVELRTAIHRAAQTGSSIEASRVRLVVNGVPHAVIMTVRPALDEAPGRMMLIVFNEVRESLNLPLVERAERDPVVEALEAELLQLEARLRNTVGESTAFTEELRASNEELQTINEELRSTTEELETSREELQSVNEELTTVNTELTLRVEDSTKLNDDLQNLMNSAEIGTIFIDRDMKLKRFTPQAATLFNLLIADIGRPLLDITHRLDYPELSRDVRNVLHNLTRSEREVRSNDNRWFLARVVPYRTTEDRIEGAVLAFFDISLRRLVEDRLRQSEQRMRLVAESMRDYAIITMDGAGVIVTWSPGAEKILGYTADEAIGQSFGLIFSQEHRRAGLPERELQRARESGRAEDDHWHVRRDGEKVFCSGITVPLEGDGIVGFAKICRNFTQEELRERQREIALQTERATRDRLQEVSTMKDEFLAVVSHELKNPLSVIKMNAQLLARLPALQGHERALRATASIDTAVTSQLHIINDLLEFSRANMGKLVLTPSFFDWAETVANIVEAIGDDAAQKSQHLRVRTVPATIHADPVRVEQIVWNLVTNAVKFTPPGGTIEVELTTADGMACLAVRDSGIGLDLEHLQGVFEMFRQVDTGLNRRTGGLGIGLALVKQLAEFHGGRVAAESPGLGRGACFKVWLPLQDSPSAIAAQERGAHHLLGDLRVLVVDNEPQLLQAFGALLESEGARVTLCGDAEEAVRLALAGGFDAVISDLAMPERDGHWLARQLRRHDATRQLALIAVSGMTRDVDRAEAQAAGFDAHLDKPVDLGLLAETLVGVLGSPRQA